MTALALDRRTWPEVREEIAAGRDTVVMALGAFEQHGPHLPLATDAWLGDHLAWAVADHLDAFVAPTLTVGCSEHHLGFPGTLSLSPATFGHVIRELLCALAGGGFKRAVLLPSHGGNFGPLAAALKDFDSEDLRVIAVTDLAAMLAIPEQGARDFGVPVTAGGLHAGEWETSLMLVARREVVREDRLAAGFTGEPRDNIERMLAQGVRALSANGVLGDARQASADHGASYWETWVRIVLDRIAHAETE